MPCTRSRAASNRSGVRNTGLLLVVAGLLLVLVGGLVWAGALSWFGRLPGDLRWQGERVRVYVPFVSMLLLSLLLSGLAYLVRRFF
jgi:hypothetical protein